MPTPFENGSAIAKEHRGEAIQLRKCRLQCVAMGCADIIGRARGHKERSGPPWCEFGIQLRVRSQSGSMSGYANMEEFSASAQCQPVAQGDPFRMIETHLLKRQVTYANRRLTHDECSLRTLPEYPGRQPNGCKGARGATLIAHLACMQETAKSAK